VIRESEPEQADVHEPVALDAEAHEQADVHEPVALDAEAQEQPDVRETVASDAEAQEQPDVHEIVASDAEAQEQPDGESSRPFVPPPLAEDSQEILGTFGKQKKTPTFGSNTGSKSRAGRSGRATVDVPVSVEKEESTTDFNRRNRRLADSEEDTSDKKARTWPTKSKDEKDVSKNPRNPFSRMDRARKQQGTENDTPSTESESGTTWSRRRKDTDSDEGDGRTWNSGGLNRFRRSEGNAGNTGTPGGGGNRAPVDNRVYGPRARPPQANTPNAPQNVSSAVLTLTLPDGSQITVAQALIDEIKAEHGLDTLGAISLLQAQIMKQTAQEETDLQAVQEETDSQTAQEEADSQTVQEETDLQTTQEETDSQTTQEEADSQTAQSSLTRKRLKTRPTRKRLK